MKLRELKIYITLVFFLCNTLFAQEVSYLTIKNTYYSNGNAIYDKPIEKDTALLYTESNGSYISYNSLNGEFTYNISVYNQNNQKIFVRGFDLVLQDYEKLFKENYYQMIPVHYLEALEKNDRNIILNHPDRKKYLAQYSYDLGEETEESFRPDGLILSNTFVYFTIQNYYLISEVNWNDDYCELRLFKEPLDSRGFLWFQPYPDTYLKHKSDTNIKIILKFDGDYVDVWISTMDEYMGKYFVAPLQTQLEIEDLINNRVYNHTKVYWPRHADGTSDFDNENKPPMIQLEHKKDSLKKIQLPLLGKKDSTKKTESKASAPITNVSVKKTMSVTENLKLRSGEATTTSVLTVMAAGTKVKILELGKAENIDGINSNWVKVEIISGKDRDGKEIKKGTTGWCYGGYLQ